MSDEKVPFYEANIHEKIWKILKMHGEVLALTQQGASERQISRAIDIRNTFISMLTMHVKVLEDFKDEALKKSKASY